MTTTPTAASESAPLAATRPNTALIVVDAQNAVMEAS